MTAIDTLEESVEALCGDLSSIRAPRGTELNARSWSTEAPLRMLLNNLDPEVAERPEELVVYGGSGKAARNHDSLRAIVRSLLTLGDDETLLVQSGKPVGVLRTHPGAPRVLIANALLVPRWATWDEFRRLEAEGLTMFGQMTAGSWIYIGTQGILQGTYQTFAAAGEQHFGSADLAGRTILTAGLGGMGGAQPLAATMSGAAILCVEVDPARIQRRLETGYLDRASESLDEALGLVRDAAAERRPLSVGLLGNAAEVVPELASRGEAFDLVTDQTAAHDPLTGYIPVGLSLEEAAQLRASDPDEYLRRARASIARHVEGMLELVRSGSYVFDYGNNLRGEAYEAGVEEAFSYPGFVPAYIRPLFCRGIGPFRWAVLSGDERDIATIDAALKELFPDDTLLQRWLELAPERVQFQGLPARICWLGLGDRARAGLAINELVRSGEVRAPVVIGRDHLDSGSVASPYRETEAMRDGSDAIADWPILNALVNVAAGATWVSVHHGGGVGIGNSIHAGMVVVADGTDEMAERLERVLTTDPATGVLRHLDAGYEEAVEAAAAEHGLEPPMSPPAPSEPVRRTRAAARPRPGTGRQLRRERTRRCAGTHSARSRSSRTRTSCARGARRGGRQDARPAALDGEVEELDGRGLCALPGSSTATRMRALPATASRSSSSARVGASYEELHAAGGGSSRRSRRPARRERTASRPLSGGTATGCCRGHDDVRGEVRLRARPRDRARVAARDRGRGRHPDVAGRPRGPAGVRRRRLPTSTSRSPRCCPRRRGSPRRPTSSSSAAPSRRSRRDATWTPARPRASALRLHGDQFTEPGAIPLAVELGARSVDHLEATGAEGVRHARGQRGRRRAAPGGALVLGRPMPPARALVDAGAAIALATDFNPGALSARAFRSSARSRARSSGSRRQRRLAPARSTRPTCSAARIESGGSRPDIGRMSSCSMRLTGAPRLPRRRSRW